MGLENPSLMPCRILVVEDDPVTRTVLETILRSMGATVLATGTGEESLQLLVQEVFDLVLLDLHPEGMSGLEVAAQIRSMQGNTPNAILPIIAITGEKKSEILQQCQEFGINECLEKPFEMEVLKLLVNTWCRERELQNMQESKGETFPSNADENDSYVQRVWKKFEGDGKFIETLLLTFQCDVPEKVSQMEEAYTNEDWRTLERIAHSLKGAAGMLELTTIRDAASQLELLIKNKDYLHLRSLIKKLKNLFYQVDFHGILESIKAQSEDGGRSDEDLSR
ncbi:MAG: response regulator [Spirochaetes bacterium]|nr:response regulator [Spirochaetota bacterium]